MWWSPDYTPRHAMVMSAGVAVLGGLWMGFCLSLRLPLHPWCSVALAGVVGASLFSFAWLDPAGRRMVSAADGLWGFLLLVCVALAAIFGPSGGPFPRWAWVPLLAFGGAFTGVMSYFALRSLFRLAAGIEKQRDRWM